MRSRLLIITACLLVAGTAGAQYARRSERGSYSAASGYARTGSSTTPQSLTNVEKLSLPLDTPVGTRVMVSESAIKITFSFIDVDDLLMHVQFLGGAEGYDSRLYMLFGDGEVEDSAIVDTRASSPPNLIATINQLDGGITATMSVFLSTIADLFGSIGIPTLVEPSAITLYFADSRLVPLFDPQVGGGTESATIVSTPQTLAAPITAEGGMFVATGAQEGMYSKRGSFGGKGFYNRLGSASGNEDGAYALFWNATQWQFNDSGGSAAIYSPDDVATPDLCTNWFNPSDDSPASITVITSVTQGELDAGLRTSDGVTRPVNGSENGRNKYTDVLGVASDVSWNGSEWSDSIGGNTAFPWDATWDGITVERDNTASEANWRTLP